MLPTRIAESTSKSKPPPAAANEKTKEEDDTGVEDNNDASESGHQRVPRRYLACPFYKHNASQHMICVRFRLRRVRDVKQHLNRCHSRHMQCPVCGSEFKDSPGLESHIRMRKCREPPGGFEIQGVTAQQGKLLSRRVKRKIGEESQWYGIWRILFPGSERPPSPYLINELDEAVNTVKDTWKRQGEDIVSSVLIRGLADATMGRNTAGNDCRPHAATRKHVMKMSQCVLDELIRRIQLDSRKIMGPSLSVLDTGDDSALVGTEQEPEHEDQEIWQSLDVDGNQEQHYLSADSMGAGQGPGSGIHDCSQGQAVEPDQKPPLVWDSKLPSDIGNPSMVAYEASPESNMQPETPSIGWMTAGFPGSPENSLSTFQGPTDGSFPPGLWFPAMVPWMEKLHGGSGLSCESMSMTAFPACSRESSISWAPTPGQGDPFIVPEGMLPEDCPGSGIIYGEISPPGLVPWE
ncbi:hypothetical protein RB597_000013 [Gaeumannomyces tritici]